MKACISIISFFILLSSAYANEVKEYSVTLDPNDKFNVTWSSTGTEPKDQITFTLTVETTGWVGLGFSPQGSMSGADIIIAWVDRDGNAYLQDMMADSNSLPTRDISQDVTLVSAVEADGKTTITFTRKLNSCDERDRAVMQSDTVRLIYAYSFKDPSDNRLTSADYHGARRGSRSLYLFDPIPPAEHIPEGSLRSEIANNQYKVPEDDTTYFCSFHSAPALKKKHHLIGIEPLITPGNEGVVHHIILYACWNVTLEHIRGSNKTDGICYTSEMPEFAESCRNIVYGWAVGGGNYYYPEEAGYPLGDIDSAEFFMLETHYDNPSEKSGVIDSSGFRLIYTPTLRSVDVGYFSAGGVYGIMVPPKTEEFEVTQYCHSSCTESWIPPEGISVFSYVLHAHLLGIKIKTEIYRDGKSAEILAEDNNYDFNFQENRLLAEPKKLYPGDTLKITCTMNSSKRSKVTYGGQSSREEMCLTFLGYYPKQPVTACNSSPLYLYDSSHQLFTALGVEAQSNPGSPLIDLQSTFENISWNQDLISKAQTVVKAAGHTNQCTNSKGQSHEDVDQYFGVEKYSVETVKTESDVCSAVSEERGGVNSGANISRLSVAVIGLTSLFISLVTK